MMDQSDLNFCDSVYNYYAIPSLIPIFDGKIALIMLVSGVVNAIMSLLTVFWIRSQRINAQNGLDDAVKSVIFPVFVKVLWFSAACSVFAGLVVTFIPLNLVNDNYIYPSILYASVSMFQHAVIEGIAFLLIQKGCGKFAANSALKWTVGWSIITFLIQFTIFYQNGVIADVLEILWDGSMFCFYLALWIAPKDRLFRRPAVITYSKFWTLYRLLALVTSALYFTPATRSIGACGYIFSELLLFSVLQPWICYYTLLQDSRWWQGIDINNQYYDSDAKKHKAKLIASTTSAANNNHHHHTNYTCTNTNTSDSCNNNKHKHKKKSSRNNSPIQTTQTSIAESSDDIRSPLLGNDFNIVTAQSLADTMDQMRVQGNVKMLNFACIKLHRNHYLGAGSFSKVYSGSYRGKPCAIKLIYTVDLTANVIKRVAAEASILSRIRHPNVVNILGVSVLPPSVCLILELCKFGSLSDIIRGKGFDWSQEQCCPLKLTDIDKIHLALGCASGVAAVHHVDSAICHRDIKSFNFLVDHCFTVKIADLELGITTGVNKFSIYEVVEYDLYEQDELLATPQQLERLQQQQQPHFNDSSSRTFSASARGGVSAPVAIDAELVEPDEMLANWMAPEVITNKKFTQASDIYSLGLVLWEIMSSKLPFDGDRQAAIRLKLKQQYRHPIPPVYQNTEFGRIVESCWQENSAERPTANEVVQRLQALLEAECLRLLPGCSHHTSTTDIQTNMLTHNNTLITPNEDSSKALNSLPPQLRQPSHQQQQHLPANAEDFSCFDRHGGCWLIVTADAPHSIVHATKSFNFLFQLDHYHNANAINIGINNTSGSRASSKFKVMAQLLDHFVPDSIVVDSSSTTITTTTNSTWSNFVTSCCNTSSASNATFRNSSINSAASSHIDVPTTSNHYTPVVLPYSLEHKANLLRSLREKQDYHGLVCCQIDNIASASGSASVNQHNTAHYMMCSLHSFKITADMMSSTTNNNSNTNNNNNNDNINTASSIKTNIYTEDYARTPPRLTPIRNNNTSTWQNTTHNNNEVFNRSATVLNNQTTASTTHTTTDSTPNNHDNNNNNNMNSNTVHTPTTSSFSEYKRGSFADSISTSLSNLSETLLQSTSSRFNSNKNISKQPVYVAMLFHELLEDQILDPKLTTGTTNNNNSNSNNENSQHSSRTNSTSGGHNSANVLGLFQSLLKKRNKSNVLPTRKYNSFDDDPSANSSSSNTRSNYKANFRSQSERVFRLNSSVYNNNTATIDMNTASQSPIGRQLRSKSTNQKDDLDSSRIIHDTHTKKVASTNNLTDMIYDTSMHNTNTYSNSDIHRHNNSNQNNSDDFDSKV